jgi:hypothetical protein
VCPHVDGSPFHVTCRELPGHSHSETGAVRAWREGKRTCLGGFVTDRDWGPHERRQACHQGDFGRTRHASTAVLAIKSSCRNGTTTPRGDSNSEVLPHRRKRGLFEAQRPAGGLAFRTHRVTQGAPGCQREIGVVRAKVNASRPREFQEPFIQSAGAGSIGQNSGEGFENSTATCESPACRGPW